jgi:hypothetical protein
MSVEFKFQGQERAQELSYKGACAQPGAQKIRQGGELPDRDLPGTLQHTCVHVSVNEDPVEGHWEGELLLLPERY